MGDCAINSIYINGLHLCIAAFHSSVHCANTGVVVNWQIPVAQVIFSSWLLNASLMVDTF